MVDHVTGPIEGNEARPSGVAYEFWDETGGILVAEILDLSECRVDNAELKAANARRLEACWNACQGIPTEMLEALCEAYDEDWRDGPLVEFVDELQDEANVRERGHTRLWRAWAREEPDTLKERVA